MKKQQKAMLAVLGLMALTSFALMNFVDVTLEDQPGVRMVLPPALDDWKGEPLLFCHAESCQKEFTGDQIKGDPEKCPECGGPLYRMTLGEWEALPKDTEFTKAIYKNSAGASVFASIVLTGRDRESIHRPERCIVGQGHRIESIRTLDVPISADHTLKATIILTRRQWSTAQGVVNGQEGYYLYWFVGQGRETYSHWWRMGWLAWDRIVNSVAHKWAYVAVSGHREPGSDSYIREIQSFVPPLYKAIVLTPDEIKAAREKGAAANAAKAPANP